MRKTANRYRSASTVHNRWVSKIAQLQRQNKDKSRQPSRSTRIWEALTMYRAGIRQYHDQKGYE